MAERHMVDRFIGEYEEEFNKEGDFPALGEVKILKDGMVAIHLITGDYDQGFEDQEIDWLKDYFKQYGIGYDQTIPAIILY